MDTLYSFRNKILIQQIKETIDGIIGMDGFEKIMYQKFELTDVDWNMLGSRKSMEKVDDELYIKTLIVEL